MGQIQNAILNTLGSAQQMAQLYKFTDAYVKQRENKTAEAKQRDLERDVKTGKIQMSHQQARGKLIAGIRQGGFTEEQKKQYKEEYGHLSGLTQTEIGVIKRELTNQIKKTQKINLDPNDPELMDLYLKSEYLEQKYPAKDKKANAQKSPQEQADTNGNIEKAKNTIKGGKK